METKEKNNIKFTVSKSNPLEWLFKNFTEVISGAPELGDASERVCESVCNEMNVSSNYTSSLWALGFCRPFFHSLILFVIFQTYAHFDSLGRLAVITHKMRCKKVCYLRMNFSNEGKNVINATKNVRCCSWQYAFFILMIINAQANS